MKKYLYLDDERMPYISGDYMYPVEVRPMYRKEDWVIVRNYDEFVDYIETNGVPDVVSFDHDLADEHYRPSMYNPDKHYSNYYSDGTFKEKTGYECAWFLCDYCIDNSIPIPEWYVHSMNPVGSDNIKSVMRQAEKFMNAKNGLTN